MNFEPRLVGKEPLVRIPEGSSCKDTDLSQIDLSAFRSLMRESAQSLSPWELLPQVFLELIEKIKPTRVGIFLPKLEWAEATNLIALTQSIPTEILGPVIKDGELFFQSFDETLVTEGPHYTKHLKVDPLQISQEKFPDLLFVPALACDLQGRRIGRGKGYYDKYLSKARARNPKLKTCAVLHSTFLFNALPDTYFHSGDQKVHSILTENKFFTTNGNEVPS